MHAATPTRVLIAGGGYAGLVAAINLLKLCDGKTVLSPSEKALNGNGPNGAAANDAENPQVPVRITIADERDGFCSCLFHC